MFNNFAERYITYIKDHPISYFLEFNTASIFFDRTYIYRVLGASIQCNIHWSIRQLPLAALHRISVIADSPLAEKDTCFTPVPAGSMESLNT